MYNNSYDNSSEDSTNSDDGGSSVNSSSNLLESFGINGSLNNSEIENKKDLFNLLDISNIPIVQDDMFIKKFGLKSIGTIGGIALLIGNLTGPGLVNISYEFQQGGWVLSLLGYILMMGLSSLAGLFIIESMSNIPGNSKFQLRIEFTMICRIYFGKLGYMLAQLFINASLLISNIASIIICAQVMDSILLFMFGKTCGVSFTNGWICIDKLSVDLEQSSPFSEYMLFTLGYLSIIAIVVPLGFMNLNDNIIIQIACVAFMFLIVISWIVIFILIGISTDNLPSFGGMSGISQIIGNCMFNYAYITTIPSWVNESKPSVNVKSSLWISSSISTLIFIVIGVLGGLTFKNISADSDLLSLIVSNHSNLFSKFSVYLFPFIVLSSSIPVFSIIVRYNLTQNRFLAPCYANFIAILLPWIIVIPFQTGTWLNKISNYSSLFFGSIANFIIPFALYLKSLQFKNTNHSTLSRDQKLILQEISYETVDWEENDYIVTNFKSLSGVPSKYSKLLAQFSLILLTILIPVVIFSNFYF